MTTSPRNRIGVIVPIYNEASKGDMSDDLDFLQSLHECDEYDVVLIDDGSTDDSAEVIEEYLGRYPKSFRAVVRKKNGRKIGAIATGMEVLPESVEFVLLLDFDTRLDSKAISAIGEVATAVLQNDELGAVAFRVTPPRSGGWLAVMLTYDYLIGRSMYKVLAKEKAARCVSGAASMWTRDVLEKILQFHSGQHSGDDFELPALLLKEGLGVKYLASVVAVTKTPLGYLSLLKQRTRWQLGALETFRKEILFFGRAVLDIRKGRSLGLMVLWEWLTWLAIPLFAWTAYLGANEGIWGPVIFLLSVDAAATGTAVILMRDELDSRGEAVLMSLLMTPFKLSVIYPARILAAVAFTSGIIGSTAQSTKR